MDAMSGEESRLDVYLAKTTNPLVDDIDCDLLNGLCEAINERPDGPQIALRFIAHKIQSPQEIEAMHGLNLLAKLIPNCGHRLVDEIGKFRFLNEIIKVVSPKYLAHRTSPKVKQRVIELMFIWSLELKEMPKIFEAYQMLKKQGIVTDDPTHVLPNYRPPTPPLPRPKDEIFDDERNAQMLQKLLKSGRPEDLDAANRLIKSMAKEADKRMDLKTRFESEIETVYNNAHVLSDMLSFYSSNDSSTEEKDLMRELFESCERLRIRLFKLANDFAEDDPNLTTLFNANDELTKVINSYKQKFGVISKDKSNKSGVNQNNQTLSLLDITSPTHSSEGILNDEELLDDHLYSIHCETNGAKNSSFDVLQELKEVFLQNKSELSPVKNPLSNDILLPDPIRPSNSSLDVNKSDKNSKSGPLNAFEELDVLSQSLMKSNLSSDEFKYKYNQNNEQSKASLNELQKLQSNAKISQKEKNETNDSVQPLTDINISLDSIEPNDTKPINLYDKNNIKVILYLTSNLPRIDVKVVVITIVNTNPHEVSNINFLAAVPKSMRVKLQAMSPGNSLPAYRPFVSPTVITQVMLIARNVNKDEKVRLKYKFSYILNNESHSDIGEIDSLFEVYDKS